MSTSAVVAKVVDTLLRTGARRATKYLSPSFVVSACRPAFGGRRARKPSRHHIMLKMGLPNYAERRFIRACKRAGEPFPVRKLQLRLLRD